MIFEKNKQSKSITQSLHESTNALAPVGIKHKTNFLLRNSTFKNVADLPIVGFLTITCSC